MDVLNQLLDTIASSTRHVTEYLKNTDLPIHPSGILLILVIIGVGTAALYANMQNTSDILKGKENIGIGSGFLPKQGKDAPPIPEPTEIVSLRIYPIKSCRGIDVSSTRLRRTGLTLDRNWMLIDQKTRHFMTIREDSRMTLVDTKLVQDDNAASGSPETTQLEIRIHGTDQRVAIPAYPTAEWLKRNTTLSTVEIWEQDTDAWEYGPAINAIFTDFFAKPVALVYKGPTARHVAVNGRPELYGEAVPHHFADVVSLQVASEASLRDLNRRLAGNPDADRLTIERFRPNIIVRGHDDRPWEEDTWKRIRLITTLPAREALYKLDLDVVARCARCQVPNVHPDTAAKHPKQPWGTLMSFRRVDTGGAAKYKPCFGMLAIPKNEGIVAVGAKVECLETTSKHLYNTAKFSDL